MLVVLRINAPGCRQHNSVTWVNSTDHYPPRAVLAFSKCASNSRWRWKAGVFDDEIRSNFNHFRAVVKLITDPKIGVCVLIIQTTMLPVLYDLIHKVRKITYSTHDMKT